MNHSDDDDDRHEWVDSGDDIVEAKDEEDIKVNYVDDEDSSFGLTCCQKFRFFIK